MGTGCLPLGLGVKQKFTTLDTCSHLLSVYTSILEPSVEVKLWQIWEQTPDGKVSHICRSVRVIMSVEIYFKVTEWKWNRTLIHWKDLISEDEQEARIQVGVLRIVTPCNVGEDGGNKVLRNVGILPQHHTASQSGRPRIESSSPWKPQMLHISFTNKTEVTSTLHNLCEIRKLLILIQSEHLLMRRSGFHILQTLLACAPMILYCFCLQTEWTLVFTMCNNTNFSTLIQILKTSIYHRFQTDPALRGAILDYSLT
jgi:hypothetical protein